jgi:hypothetical protein
MKVNEDLDLQKWVTRLKFIHVETGFSMSKARKHKKVT